MSHSFQYLAYRKSNVIPLFPSDAGQFEDSQESQIWVNNTKDALLKWRYTPDSTDIPPPAVIICSFDQDGQKNVIKRTGNNIPVIESDIQNTVLRGKVQPYLDSTDSTIFGFKLVGVTTSYPMKYKCTGSFNTAAGLQIRNSQELTLEVLGNIAPLLLFCFLKLIFLFFETFPFKVAATCMRYFARSKFSRSLVRKKNLA